MPHSDQLSAHSMPNNHPGTAPKERPQVSLGLSPSGEREWRGTSRGSRKKSNMFSCEISVCFRRLRRSLVRSHNLSFPQLFGIRSYLRRAGSPPTHLRIHSFIASVASYSSFASSASPTPNAHQGMLRLTHGLLLIHSFAQIDGLRGSGRRNND